MWNKINDGMPSVSTWCLVYGYGDYGPGIVMALWSVPDPEDGKPHWYFPMGSDHFDPEDDNMRKSPELAGGFWSDQTHFLCINDLTYYKPIEMPDPRVLTPQKFK